MLTTRRLALTTGALSIAAAGLIAALPGATPAATAAAQAASGVVPGTFTVDGGHSNVNFRVVYMSSSHFFGRFNSFSGTYLVDVDAPETSFINLTIDTASVDTNSEGRDNHLRNSDFFSARQFPQATFVSTSAEKVDDDTMRFTGDFTLRGVTNEITVDVDTTGEAMDPRRNKTRAGWIASFTFNRSDYNVSYGIPGLSDETELTVSITGLQN